MAAKLVREMSSAAADWLVFVTELSEELPVLGTVLKTLSNIRDKVEGVKSNREDLAALHNRCAYLTACVIDKCRRGSFDLGVALLEACVVEVGKFVDRCSRRGMVSNGC